MQLRLNFVWLLLILLVGLFSLIYARYTLFPGQVSPEAWSYFGPGQVSLGQEYNQVKRLVFIGSFIAQAAFLLWVVFFGRGVALSRWLSRISGGSFWGSLLLFFLALWLVLRLISLPFTLFISYFWQHRWGFSTQTMESWWMDYAKGAGLELILSVAGFVIFFWVFRRWPGIWWLVTAVFISLWLIVQSFLWPVMVSPLFNSFVPTKDAAVVNMVGELSKKAGLPVDQVLVMDASQRTTMANAYFTGLGKTKRIVLYDTLLKDYPLDQVKAVVAHEMAHWRQGHIIKGLTGGIIGNFIFWGLLFLLLRSTLPDYRRDPPYTWAVVLLFFLLTSFATSPLHNYISRSMEKEADRVAVMLTGDVQAAVNLQVNLAAKNMSDISPPAFIQWFSYSHPPVLTRIEIIQQALSHNF